MMWIEIIVIFYLHFMNLEVTEIGIDNLDSIYVKKCAKKAWGWGVGVRERERERERERDR